jgi:hypothetical protein
VTLLHRLEGILGFQRSRWSPPRPDAPLVPRGDGGPTDPAMSWNAIALRLGGQSCCMRCMVPWDLTQRHNTNYCPHGVGAHGIGAMMYLPDGRPVLDYEHFLLCSGTFALCEPCWSEMTVLERLPYYLQLIDDWYAEHETTAAENVRKYGAERVQAWRMDLDVRIPFLLAAVMDGN